VNLRKKIAAGLGSLALLSTGLFAAGSTVAPSPAVAAEPERPNVLLVNLDDMRADMLPYLPNVQKYMFGGAGEGGGTRYDKAYTSIPACCPSRAAFFTGQYTHNNGQIVQSDPGVDLSNVLPVWLRDAGYFTGHSGKYIHWWKINPAQDATGNQSGVAPGWDRWTQFSGADYTDPDLNFDGVYKPNQPGFLTEILFNRAESYLDDWQAQDDSKPWLLSLAPKDPHSGQTTSSSDLVDAEGWGDGQVNPSFRGKPVTGHPQGPAFMEADRTDKPGFIQSNNLKTADYFKRVWDQQLRMVKGVDKRFGELMEKLEAQGERDNTLVVFTSDNGYLLGEHKWKAKFLPYSESTDIPFLVRWTGAPAGKTVKQQHVNNYQYVTQVDIAATVMDATGATPGRVLDGHSLLGVDQTTGYKRWYAAAEYWLDEDNNGAIPGWRMIRTDNYQYVEYRYGPGSNGELRAREFYNLQNDPHMLNNIFKTGTPDPQRVAQAEGLMENFRTCSGPVACP